MADIWKFLEADKWLNDRDFSTSFHSATNELPPGTPANRHPEGRITRGVQIGHMNFGCSGSQIRSAGTEAGTTNLALGVSKVHFAKIHAKRDVTLSTNCPALPQ
jgi:hypothetical protein